MEEELNIFKKSSLAFAAIASVLTFAPDLSFVSNQAKAEFPTKPIKVYVGFMAYRRYQYYRLCWI